MEQRAILETLRDALVVADADGSIVFANAAALELFGYPPGALEGRPVASLLPERYRVPEHVRSGPLLAGPRGPSHTEPVRLEVLAADGRELPAEVSVDRADVDGRRVSVWLVRSARERAELESKLALSDALAAMADAFVQMTATPDPARVARVVVDTLVQRLGGAGARLWTYDAAHGRLELSAWAGLSPSVDGADVCAAEPERYGLPLADVLATPHARMLAAPSGAGDPELPAWFREQGLTAYALHPLSFGDRLVGVLAYFSRERLPQELFQVIAAFGRHAAVALHDLSEQQAARRQIEVLAREAEARTGEFESIVANMPDAVFVVRGDRVAFVNATAARLLGFDDPAKLQLPLADFVRVASMRDADGGPVAPDKSALARVVRGEVITGLEARIAHGRTGRDLWVQLSGAPLHDGLETARGGVVVATEITRLKELEHSKDEWLAIAAHELRTPLTPITVHLQMAQRRLHMGRPLSPEVFDKALEQVKRLSRLVNGLLDVTRLQAGQLDLALEDVDVREIAEAIVERTRHGAPAHTLVLDLDTRPVLVRGDRARLDEVLSALVDNAVKYSPDGGEVWVRVHGRDGGARIEVRDEGIGIPEDERARIFERYFRAGSVPQTQYGGLGLGLWIAGKVVQKHGGEIGLESAQGRGSTFTVRLPLVRAEGAVAGEAATAGARARVLVVDDDAAVLEAVEGLLDDDGYDVRVARSGSEALATARSFAPDVMLLDLRMPGMDGWEVRRRLAADPDLANIPVVLVSADRDARVRASGMNVQGFVAKPFDLDEIERVLRTVVPERNAEHGEHG